MVALILLISPGTELSDAEWSYIEPHLPFLKGHGRARTHSLREIIGAIFYVLKSDCFSTTENGAVRRIEPDLSRQKGSTGGALYPSARRHG
jgi:Putative transposase of IS4/5 family (DUF4096)